MSAPRRIVLSEKHQPWSAPDETLVRVKSPDECSFADETLTRFIEEDAVLDLLERHLPADGKPRCAADRETVALLEACGRRPGPELVPDSTVRRYREGA